MRRAILLSTCLAALGLLVPAGRAADRLVPSQYPTILDALNNAQTGDRIVISGQVVLDQQVVVAINDLTITSGNPRADIRRTRFLVTASGVTFQDVDINGKSPAGARSPDARSLVTFTSTASNGTLIGCKIVNPASGTGTGVENSSDDVLGPGACVNVQAEGALSVRNCNFANDMDADVNNEVGILLGPGAGNPSVGPVLIEGCTFRAVERNVSIVAPWSNITIRNCGFSLSNQGAIGQAPADVYVNTDWADQTFEGAVNNLLIEGNVLGGVESPQGSRYSYPVATLSTLNNCILRNNHLTTSNNNIGVYWRGRGNGLVIENNRVDVRGTANETSYGSLYLRCAGSTANNFVFGDPRLRMKNVIVRGNVFTNPTGTGELAAITLRDWYENTVIEDNVIRNYLLNGIYMFEAPNGHVIRNNYFQNVGTVRGGVNAAIAGALQDGAAIGNTIVGCQVGIRLFTSSGVNGTAPSPPFLDRRPKNNVIARNAILGCVSTGILDQSGEVDGTDTQGTYLQRSFGNRYVNNTITNPGAEGMALRGDQHWVYNNIFFGGTAAVRDNRTTGANTSFAAIGFNATYATNYVGIAPPATDIQLPNSPFVGGNNPTTRAGVTPKADAPVLSAGTGDGLSPDYITDIGAIQLGAVTDTSVPAAGWALYR